MKTATSADTQPLELLISSLLYLMTRYTANPCPNIRQAVIHHLAMLQEHPNTRNADALINTARRLTSEWSRNPESRAQSNPRQAHQTLQ